MKQGLGLALFAVAGYFLYEWLKGQQGTVVAATSPQTGATTALAPVPANSVPIQVSTYTPTGQPTTLTVAVPASSLRSSLLQAANSGYNSIVQGGGDSILLSVDEWDYWYNTIKPGALDENTPSGAATSVKVKAALGIGIDNESAMVTVDQYISGLSSVGLSGLGAYQYGLPVASISLPPSNAPSGSGSQIMPYSTFPGWTHGIGIPLERVGMQGLGRVYLSGMGYIGAGYGINETFSGDAQKYELATKWVM